MAYRGIEVSYGRLAAEMDDQVDSGLKARAARLDDQASDSGLKARAARYARYAPDRL